VQIIIISAGLIDKPVLIHYCVTGEKAIEWRMGVGSSFSRGGAVVDFSRGMETVAK